jgi:hypothetical protein
LPTDDAEDRVGSGFYGGLAAELAAQLRRLHSFTKHRGASGYYHEEILRNVLRSFLGSRYSLRTGFVYFDANNVSRQGDILIVDEFGSCPYLYRHGDFAIVDPRALACVIEVKTTLTKQTFADAVDNYRSFVDVYAAASVRPYPLGLTFAFESPVLSRELLSDWYRSVPTPNEARYYPTSVFSMTAGMMMVWPNLSAHIQVEEPKQEQYVNTFSVFLAHIRKAIDIRLGIKGSSYDYACITGNFTSNVYSFGRGHWEPNVADMQLEGIEWKRA